MSFNIKYEDLKKLVGYLDEQPDSGFNIVETLKSVIAWMETMPEDDRIVYLLGRKAS